MTKNAPFLMIGLPFLVIITYAILGATIIGYTTQDIVQETLAVEKSKYDQNFNLTIPYRLNTIELCFKQNDDKVWCQNQLIPVEKTFLIDDDFYPKWRDHHLSRGSND